MSICVLTGCLPNYNALALYTIHLNKQPYCQRHGYDLELVTNVRPNFQDPKSHAGGFSWSRLERMWEMVASGSWEWVWCVGCDTLITNMRLPLEDLTRSTQKHILICGERVAPLQADSFLVRGSPEGASWLRDLLDQYPAYCRDPWVENQTMIDRRDRYAAITEIVPQYRLNAYDYRRFYYLGDKYRDGTDCYGNRGQWQPGDFLIHWPAATLDERLAFVAEYMPQIVN